MEQYQFWRLLIPKELRVATSGLVKVVNQQL
jgi:hypothetical protein